MKHRQLQPAWRTKGTHYVLGGMFVPVWKTFVYAVLVLECARLKLVLEIALHQPNPFIAFLKFLGLWLPLYVGIALPVALFVGVMFGLARICKTRELDALHSVGIGLHQLMAPIVGFGLVVWLLGLVVLGWAQPLALYASKVFVNELEQSASVMLAGTDLFLTRDQKTIMLEGISADGKQFKRVFIHEIFPDGKTMTTAGSSGYLQGEGELKDKSYFVDYLDVMELFQNPNALTATGARSFSTVRSKFIQGSLGEVIKITYRPRGESEYEWTLGDLLLGNPGMPFHPEPYKLSAELNYRFAQLMFILLLPIIAAVVVIEPRRKPGPIRLLAGLLIVLGFHQYLSYGTSLSRNNTLPPLLSLWLPLTAVYAIFLLKFWKLAYRPAFLSAR